MELQFNGCDFPSHYWYGFFFGTSLSLQLASDQNGQDPRSTIVQEGGSPFLWKSSQGHDGQEVAWVAWPPTSLKTKEGNGKPQQYHNEAIRHDATCDIKNPPSCLSFL